MPNQSTASCSSRCPPLQANSGVPCRRPFHHPPDPGGLCWRAPSVRRSPWPFPLSASASLPTPHRPLPVRLNPVITRVAASQPLPLWRPSKTPINLIAEPIHSPFPPCPPPPSAAAHLPYGLPHYPETFGWWARLHPDPILPDSYFSNPWTLLNLTAPDPTQPSGDPPAHPCIPPTCLQHPTLHPQSVTLAGTHSPPPKPRSHDSTSAPPAQQVPATAPPPTPTTSSTHARAGPQGRHRTAPLPCFTTWPTNPSPSYSPGSLPYPALNTPAPWPA